MEEIYEMLGTMAAKVAKLAMESDGDEFKSGFAIGVTAAMSVILAKECGFENPIEMGIAALELALEKKKLA